IFTITTNNLNLLYDNSFPRSPEELNAEIADTIIESIPLLPIQVQDESDFVESLLNRDTFIDFSSKFDFSGELAHIKPEIPKSDFDFEEEIRLIENLLYDNSFPRPPEELNAEITDTIIESIPLPIPVQDEGDIHFLKELLINDSIISHELFDSSFEDNPSIPRPPPEPPDAKTDVGEEIAVVIIDKDKFDDDYQIFMFNKVFSLLSAESEDTIFDPGSGPTLLFDIDTLTKSMNYQPVIAGNQPNSSADPQNTDADATCEVKKPKSEVHVSPSSSAKTKKHDDKTKREAKGKSLVELSTGVKNLSKEFEDSSNNNTNEVKAASTPVPAIGQ
nr:hypothetical protein [Tanacetum cinerariifolium]